MQGWHSSRNITKYNERMDAERFLTAKVLAE